MNDEQEFVNAIITKIEQHFNWLDKLIIQATDQYILKY